MRNSTKRTHKRLERGLFHSSAMELENEQTGARLGNLLNSRTPARCDVQVIYSPQKNREHPT